MTKDEQFEELVMLITEGARPATEDADAILNAGYRKAITVVRDIFNDLNEMWHKGRGFINYSDLVRLERLHEQKYMEDTK